MSYNVNIGSKIKFQAEKKPYVVKAKSDKYIICTKPFNLKHTCLYTILDLVKNIRGTHNLIFNIFDFMDQEDIDKCLSELESGEIEISYRNYIPLDIEKVY